MMAGLTFHSEGKSSLNACHALFLFGSAMTVFHAVISAPYHFSVG